MPPLTQVERLTEQFYAWERRGRGWDVHARPVVLEPPYTPFHFHWTPPGGEGIDDGRKPTMLSRLADRILGPSKRPSGDSHPGLPVIDYFEAGPDPDEAEDSFVDLRLALPAEMEVAPEAVEQVLLAVPRARRSLAFEVIGTDESVWVQFACDRATEPLLSQHLQGAFPQCAVRVEGGALAKAWGRVAGRHSVVVEFGLSDEFMLPLRVFKRFSPDPLTSVAAALSCLESGELGLLQVLFHPVRHPWAQNIMRAVLDDDDSPFFLDAPEVTSLARDKVSRPLYACLIRVAAKSRSPERALEMARTIGWALNTIANPPANRLIPLDNQNYPDSEHEQDLLERRTRRSGMILSSSELASLVHPPSASLQVEKLHRQSNRSRPVPLIATGQEYRLGINAHAGRELGVGLSEAQRSRHLYVIGASGTGKSTFLLNLILQDLRGGKGLAVLDPHGDLIDEIVRHLPDERLEDVVLLDPADAEYPIGFNFLSAHSELERTLLASDLVAVFRRLSTSWGDQMTSVLGNAILAFLESDRGGTLLDLRRFLVEPDFRREFLATVRDKEIVYYWQKEFPLLSGKPQAPVLTRLDTFLRPKTIRYMVAQQETRLDLRRTMDEGKILLARLSQGAIGEENAFLLGTLLVSKLQQLAMSRQELSASERRPFYLYVDEFHNFVTPSMEAILSGARKYGLGLILAHQDLRQIQSRSPDVLHAVLSNPYTRVCFRVGDHDARTLAEGFVHFDARDLQSLGTGEAIARVERAEYDFNLLTEPLPAVDVGSAKEKRDTVVDRSRAGFARPRAEMERLLVAASVGQASVSPSVEDSTPVPQIRQVDLNPKPSADIGRPTDQGEQRTPGRGGMRHRYLQELIRRWADANGWRATVEEELPGGLGRVDVVLRKGDRNLACEIGVSTSPEHEFKNLEKCLAAGFQWILLVSSEERTLSQLKRLVGAGLGDEQGTTVRYCVPENLPGALDSIQAETSPSDQTVRGYKVKVRVRDAPTGTQNPRRAVVGVIARAIRRLKQSSG